MAAARAIWKGVLRLGGGAHAPSVPVKLYSAVQDRSIHFHLLDAKSQQRVRQHMVDPETGKAVPNEEIRRGLEVEPGTFVVLSDDELAQLEPPASRDIEITRFVPPERINHQWYERPYYLGPDAPDAAEYFALAQALQDSGLEGVARWVMRNKPYTGALRVRDGALALVTLRHADEVLAASELPRPTGRALDPREVAMAQQLVSVLEDEFRPEDFRDEYRDRVMKLIETKAQGGKPKLHVVKTRKTAEPSLIDALAASLKSAAPTPKSGGGKQVA